MISCYFQILHERVLRFIFMLECKFFFFTKCLVLTYLTTVGGVKLEVLTFDPIIYIPYPYITVATVW